MTIVIGTVHFCLRKLNAAPVLFGRNEKNGQKSNKNIFFTEQMLRRFFRPSWWDLFKVSPTQHTCLLLLHYLGLLGNQGGIMVMHEWVLEQRLLPGVTDGQMCCMNEMTNTLLWQLFNRLLEASLQGLKYNILCHFASLLLLLCSAYKRCTHQTFG